MKKENLSNFFFFFPSSSYLYHLNVCNVFHDNCNALVYQLICVVGVLTSGNILICPAYHVLFYVWIFIVTSSASKVTGYLSNVFFFYHFIAKMTKSTMSVSAEFLLFKPI